MSTHRRRAIASISQKPDLTDYVCFCANIDNSKVSIELCTESGSQIIGDYDYPEIEYSRNKKTWFPLIYNSSDPIILEHVGDKIFLRGDNPNGLTVLNDSGKVVGYSTFFVIGKIEVSGNLQTLLDKAGQQTSVPERAFSNLFRSCLMTGTPKLNATELSKECYKGLFANSSMEEAPVLPAIELKSNCYERMFSGCVQLKKPAQMLAQKINKNSCDHMYAACSNLETLPKILATKVLENGLKGMFNGCSKISIKTLPDTTHQTEYRIPYSGSGEGSQQLYMFYNTDTDIPEGTADINTTYFTSNELI